MTKNKVDNIEMLNSIRETLGGDYKDRIPVATTENLQQLTENIMSFPTTKNQFIETLTNVIGKTIFLNRLYSNPFKFFKKGTLPFGTTVRNIFVEMIECKSFGEHFDNSNSVAGDELGTTKASVIPEYYEQNYQHIYKISISDKQLKGAFHSQDGLSTLSQNIVTSALSSAEHDEYLIVKHLVCKSSQKSVTLTGYNALSSNEKAKALTTEINTLISEFGFIKDKYNAQGVKTHTPKNEIVIVTTPRNKAMIDVELLSTAFNMNKADVNARLVVIDEFILENGNVDPATLAVVCDENIIQMYDTENSTESTRVASTLTTNTFFHRWGIASGCKFVNGVKIKSS
ncbi:MAG: hypothetical protein ACRCX2_33385 [Paraclostridium sp.]